MAEEKSVQISKKKKRWMGIYSSKDFGSALLGESYVSDSANLIGKRLSVDLSLISKTRNPNVRIVFEVKKIEDAKASSEPIGYYVLPTYLKRFIRKDKTKMDISYLVKIKGDVNCAVKIFMVAKSKVKSSVSKALKVELNKLIEKDFKNRSFGELFDSITSYTLQKSLKNSLNKIYPLYAFEIRVFYKK